MPAYCVITSHSSPCTRASKPCCTQCYFYPNQSRRLKTHQPQKRIFAYIHNSLVTELVTRILRNLSRAVILHVLTLSTNNSHCQITCLRNYPKLLQFWLS